MEEIFKTTAAIRDDGSYYHFGIRKGFASLYGNKEDQIRKLQFKKSSDQTPAESINNAADKMKPDYWGYFDFERNEFTLIYPKYFLLQMCFPNGIAVMEERGFGKAYRIELL